MSTVDEFCPYVWPGPHTEAHRKYFFGRATEKRVIIGHLLGAPLTVLAGPSGVGKSSVLGAAVVPELREQSRAAVVIFDTWHDPDFLDALKRQCVEAVETATGQAPAIDPAQPLDDLLAELCRALAGSILLVLDQFEQYFVHHPEPLTDFEEELASTVNRPDVDANVLLVVRDDWVVRLGRLQAGIPDVLGNLLTLNHLTATGAEAAIRDPLRVYSEQYPASRRPVEVEDALVARLLADTRPELHYLDEAAGVGQSRGERREARVDTSLLQLVLMRLWFEERETTLRLRTLEEAGGTAAIVRGYVDSRLHGLLPPAQDAAARMFRYLVTPTGVKIAHTREDVIDFGRRPGEGLEPDLEPSDVETVLGTLEQGRILRRLTRPERYEISHDVLARAVLDWRRRREEDRLAREAYAAWKASRAWGVLRDVWTGTAHTLRGANALTVGRSVEYWPNDIDVRVQGVSRIHLLLFADGQAYDMRSLNGTTVNAEPLGYGPPRTIQSGDIITLAGVPFAFERIDYPALEDPRIRVEPPIEDREPLSGWAVLIDGGGRAVRPLIADHYVILVDQQRRCLILEEEAAGRRLVVARAGGEGAVATLANESDAPLTLLMREQYPKPGVGPDAPPDAERVLVGRGYAESEVPPGHGVRLYDTVTCRFGDVYFQIVSPPPESR